MSHIDKFGLIAEEISRCKRCDKEGIDVKHCAKPMVRGTGRILSLLSVRNPVKQNSPQHTHSQDQQEED